MTTQKPLYGTSNQTITLTIASLANSGARASTVVDNSTNLFIDALIQLKVKTNAAGTSATGFCNLYVYGTANGGTNYTEGATGTDAGITLTVPPNAIRLASFNTVANAATYIVGPVSVAAAFNGIIPDHWGIILENKSGAALDATAGNHGIWYQGVQAQSV